MPKAPLFRAFAASLAILAMAGLAGCGDGVPSEAKTLSIMSGSENKSLEPLIKDFCDDKGWDCPITWSGSVDIMLALQEGSFAHNAVWPAQSRWIDLGDKGRRVKHADSIFTSPVVLAIKRSEARDKGLIDHPVTWTDIARMVDQGELKYLMTSATQSNSGFSAYIAMLTAMAAPENGVLQASDLDNQQTLDKVRALLAGVERTSGSSGWLKDLYVATPDNAGFTAMFNYEALVIEANEALERQGREPLYAIYPADGVAVADSPLGFYSHGDKDEYNAYREAFFLELQAYLKSEKVQAALLERGRRTGLAGMMTGADPKVFRKDLGMAADQLHTTIRFPTAEVIRKGLGLYQEALRKPSLMGICLDFSGSMGRPIKDSNTTGAEQLKAAVDLLFDKQSAARYMLQTGQNDVLIVIPFSGKPGEAVIATGPDAGETIAAAVKQMEPGGATDMYACAQKAAEIIASRPERKTHVTGLLLLTDGKSNGDATGFYRWHKATAPDLPIFGITFGDADDSQLKTIADRTRARTFDGRSDLTTAFRQARGYN